MRTTYLGTSVIVSIKGGAETSDVNYFKRQGFNRRNCLHRCWETEKVKWGHKDNPDINNCYNPMAEETKEKMWGYDNLGAQRRGW